MPTVWNSHVFLCRDLILHRPYYDHMTLSPELYAANGYLPSVAYNLEDINRIEYDDVSY